MPLCSKRFGKSTAKRPVSTEHNDEHEDVTIA
jgi:hypothetical protein